MGKEEKVYLKVLRRSRTILIRCKSGELESMIHRESIDDEVFKYR